MADIRKRTGAKGTTYQVRFATTATKCGYAYKSFGTRKEALAFRDSTAVHKHAAPLAPDIVTVAEGVQKWLDICEKEGRNGREPVTKYTLENYKYRAAIIKRYEWTKTLTELRRPDFIEFRSWLLENHSRAVAHKVLTSLRASVGRRPTICCNAGALPMSWESTGASWPMLPSIRRRRVDRQLYVRIRRA